MAVKGGKGQGVVHSPPSPGRRPQPCSLAGLPSFPRVSKSLCPPGEAPWVTHQDQRHAGTPRHRDKLWSLCLEAVQRTGRPRGSSQDEGVCSGMRNRQRPTCPSRAGHMTPREPLKSKAGTACATGRDLNTRRSEISGVQSVNGASFGNVCVPRSHTRPCV